MLLGIFFKPCCFFLKKKPRNNIGQAQESCTFVAICFKPADIDDSKAPVHWSCPGYGNGGPPWGARLGWTGDALQAMRWLRFDDRALLWLVSGSRSIARWAVGRRPNDSIVFKLRQQARNVSLLPRTALVHSATRHRSHTHDIMNANSDGHVYETKKEIDCSNVINSSQATQNKSNL